ncbi:MAG: aldose epimerase family protein [Pontibacterium sp.]
MPTDQASDFGLNSFGLNVSVLESYVLKNADLTVRVMRLGATIQSIHLNGIEHSLTLGSRFEGDYCKGGPAQYMGAIVGRCANRIEHGRAMIDGKLFELDRNEGPHHLHGGSQGVDQLLWQCTELSEDRLVLSLTLADGHMGYPRSLSVSVTYWLEHISLHMEISATSTAATLCNFAGHSYFNLDGKGSALDHRLAIAADHYLPVTDTLMPTGEIRAVEGTAFDFRNERKIGDSGYDHNFCLSHARVGLREVATLVGPKSGLSMTLLTTEPGLQVYDGAHLSLASEHSVNGEAIGAFGGIALEPQVWPNAIQNTHFPSAVLRAGEVYRQHTVYRFS